MLNPDEIPSPLRGWLVGKWAVLMTGVAATLAATIGSLVLFVVVKASEKLDKVYEAIPVIRERVVTLDGRMDALAATVSGRSDSLAAALGGRIDNISTIVIAHEKRLDRLDTARFFEGRN